MSKEQHYEKGMYFMTENKMDLAIEELNQALAIDSRYGDALQAVAMAYYHVRDFDRAIEMGHRFAEVEPDNTLAYTSLSMFYHAKGMVPEAEAMGEKAREAALKSPSNDPIE